MEIQTRAFSIDDYEAAIELWKKVEGVEIAEGDDRNGVARFLTRNPGLSRIATDESAVVGGRSAVMMDGADTFII